MENGFPLFQCRRCRMSVEVHHPDVEQCLAERPACGVRREEHQKRLDAIERARNEALAAGKPFPPIVKRIGSWAKAVARWVEAGRPCRSDEEVKRIFDTFCEPCEHLQASKQSCNLCGCKVRRNGAAFLNKIRMATERCALVPPKWGGGDSDGN